ncbi:MAG TPA: hypothetical protein VEK34_05155 [Methylocella sp.]|nr:hypothetical protein [Methylocella sp.]
MLSAAIIAVILVIAFSIGEKLRPAKRVGIDWEHHQLMLRGDEKPVIPKGPPGPLWREAPPSERI